MVPILMYHQVSATPPGAYAHYTVAPATFAREMRMLSALGYRTVSPDAAVQAWSQGMSLPPRAVLITFDDGYADAVRHAVPELARHGFTATFFVVAGLLGRTSEWTRRRGVEMPLADATVLRDLAGAGFTIGSHGMTHRRLAELAESDLRSELQDSRRRLEDVLGRPVRHLAYPFGSTSDRVRRTAAESGYDTACSIEPRIARRRDDLLMLPRLHMAGADTLADFLCRLHTGGTIGTLVQRVRTTMKVSAFAR